MVEAPPIVEWLSEVVTSRLGRPACCRKVKSYDQWFVSDPVFSFVQHGMKKGSTGYRVGYFVHLGASSATLAFYLVHSPLMAQLFKRNLCFSSLRDVIATTASFRSEHRVYRSSRLAQKNGHEGHEIASSSSHEFIAKLADFDRDHGFVKDMFPPTKNRGAKGTRGPKATWAGNDFYLLLSDEPAGLTSQEQLRKLVDLSWPLFLCLYPVKPIEKRSAQLARSLRSTGVVPVCEFGTIRVPTDAKIEPSCRGNLQGAHIVPHSRGGSDRAENGMWLCEYHHRMTEGHLAGRRNATELAVRYFHRGTGLQPA